MGPSQDARARPFHVKGAFIVMVHWTSHAFHASVISPRLMYGDVTMGFSDGNVVFTGTPFRAWRVWWWAGALMRFLVLVAGAVALAPTALSANLTRGITAETAIRVGVVVAVCAVALVIIGKIVAYVARSGRVRAAERVVRLPLTDVRGARLSGKTLSLRAPLDHANPSGRWRLRLDSHEQGETLLALLGRR